MVGGAYVDVLVYSWCMFQMNWFFLPCRDLVPVCCWCTVYITSIRLFCKHYGTWTCCLSLLTYMFFCKGPALVYLVYLEVSYYITKFNSRRLIQLIPKYQLRQVPTSVRRLMSLTRTPSHTVPFPCRFILRLQNYFPSSHFVQMVKGMVRYTRNYKCEEKDIVHRW
jgi:hypothetical protein